MVAVIKKKSDAEWRKYIKEAEGESIQATLEWCSRIYEAYVTYDKSFRKWAEEWYQEYSASTLKQLARIGAEKDRLVSITNRFPEKVSNDWTALYQLTTLPDTEVEKIEKFDQKSIIHFKRQRGTDERKKKLFVAKSFEEGIFDGDFREYAHVIPDESIQLIFTDPPYDVASVSLFEDLGKVATRVLRPGGSLITYCGHDQLRDALNYLRDSGLRFWWINACLHSGQLTRMDMKGIVVGWKPILWFVKDTRGDIQTFINDTVTGGREKEHHKWQQAESESSYYIEKLTRKDGWVADFFVGGGTTAAAAKKLGRQFIGFDIDSEAASDARERLNAIT